MLNWWKGLWAWMSGRSEGDDYGQRLIDGYGLHR